MAFDKQHFIGLIKAGKGSEAKEYLAKEAKDTNEFYLGRENINTLPMFQALGVALCGVDIKTLDLSNNAIDSSEKLDHLGLALQDLTIHLLNLWANNINSVEK